MTDEQYSGWTNRETWAVALYLNNEQEHQEAALALATMNDYGEGIKEYIEQWLYDLVECGNAQAYSVLMDIGSLWRVNWSEIQEAFRADALELAEVNNA